jgi:sugar phosphate permease
MGGMVTGLMALTWVYSANRLSGSAAWGGMVKLVPAWFEKRHLPLAMAFLSLSFVFGGAIATLFAGEIAHWTNNNWRAVMAVPSLVLVVLVAALWFVLPRNHTHPTMAVGGGGDANSGKDEESPWERIRHVLVVRQMWIVLALSFGLTLFRETFNTWTVDFIKTEGGEEVSTRLAAFLSTPFDLFGALGIVALGWVFGRLTGSGRVRLLVVLLGLLAVLLWNVPNFFRHGLWLVAASVGLIGFLSYGPYSLLAGILAVEIRGPAYVATVAGFVDGIGYVASILAGKQFGQIVDAGGYQLGFKVLAGIAAGCAVLCLFLYSGREQEAKA